MDVPPSFSTRRWSGLWKPRSRPMALSIGTFAGREGRPATDSMQWTIKLPMPTQARQHARSTCDRSRAGAASTGSSAGKEATTGRG
jgi:hypothetical protein